MLQFLLGLLIVITISATAWLFMEYLPQNKMTFADLLNKWKLGLLAKMGK
jgi:hypothetical protein